MEVNQPTKRGPKPKDHREKAKKMWDAKKYHVTQEIGKRIEELMTAKQWNRTQFAVALGQSPSIVNRFLSGVHNFTLETLVEIAGVLEVEVEELFWKAGPQTDGQLDRGKLELMIASVLFRSQATLCKAHQQQGELMAAQTALLLTIEQMKQWLDTLTQNRQ